MIKATGSIAFFDFDGTITKRDTLFQIIKFFHGNLYFYLNLVILSPYFLLYKLKVIPNWKAKELVLTRFFGGIDVKTFEETCRKFSIEVIPHLLRPDAMSEIERLKSLGIRIIIVSASIEAWIKPWCDTLTIECIGTRLQVIDKKITGKINGFNCYGPEKVNRILKFVDLADYSDISAYGDSKGDIPMLELASKAHYRTFKD